MKKRIFSIILVLALALTFAPMAFSAYDTFDDVKQEDWFYSDVGYAVNMGLVNGKTERTYEPNSNITYAETIKLASVMHQLHEDGKITLTNGDPWYQSYVDYAKKEGIITAEYDWGLSATRASFMDIFSRALPASELQEINEVPDDSIPDVDMRAEFSYEIYMLYRAGILAGSDELRSALPYDNIKRSEVATIAARMIDPSRRVSFTMPKAPIKQYSEIVFTSQPDDGLGLKVGDTVNVTARYSGGIPPFTQRLFIRLNNSSERIMHSERTDVYSDYAEFTDVVDPSGQILNYWFMWQIIDSEGTLVYSDEVKHHLVQETPTPTPTPTSIPETDGELRVVSQTGDVENISVGENTTLSFEVEGGAAPYNYQWYRVLIGGDGIPQKVHTNSNAYGMTITDDSYKYFYYCMISDANGNRVQTDPVDIFPTEFKQTLYTSMDSHTFTSDREKIMIGFGAQGGVAPYTFMWKFKHDGVVYPMDEWYSHFAGYSNPIVRDYPDAGQQYLEVYAGYSVPKGETVEISCFVIDYKGNNFTTKTITVSYP